MEVISFDPDNKKTEVFLNYSNYAKVYKKHLIARLPCIMPRLWQRFLDVTQECSFYLVGAKNGLLEIPFLKTIIKRRGSMEELYFICQGTSLEMREEFRQRVINSGLTHFVEEYQIVDFENSLYIEPRVHIAVVLYEWLDMLLGKILLKSTTH